MDPLLITENHPAAELHEGPLPCQAPGFGEPATRQKPPCCPLAPWYRAQSATPARDHRGSGQRRRTSIWKCWESTPSCRWAVFIRVCKPLQGNKDLSRGTEQAQIGLRPLISRPWTGYLLCEHQGKGAAFTVLSHATPRPTHIEWLCCPSV